MHISGYELTKLTLSTILMLPKTLRLVDWPKETSVNELKANDF